MTQVSFGSIRIVDGITVLSWEQAQNQLTADFQSETGKLYTFLFYDILPNGGNYIHLLKTNIPGENKNLGNTVLSYVPPSPPEANHRYYFVVFEQSGISSISISTRTIADIYSLDYHFKSLVGQVLFFVSPQSAATTYAPAAPVTPTYAPAAPVAPTYAPSQPTYTPAQPTYTPVAPTYTPVAPSQQAAQPTSKELWMSSSLNEGQQKYCRCLLHVAAKQPAACNTDKAWRQTREGQTCYNPYAVCSRAGERVHSCSGDYIFENIPDAELIGYASLHGVVIPNPYDRTSMLSTIRGKFT